MTSVYMLMVIACIACSMPLIAFDLQAPSDLVAEVGSASHFNLEWNDNSQDEEGFSIERQSSNEPFWVLIGFVPSDHTAYQAGGCFAGTEYQFRVRAYRGSAFSAFSNIAGGKTPVHFKDQQSVVIEGSTVRQGEGTALEMNNGDIHLYFGSFTGLGDKDVARIARKTSSDGGKTWSDMEILFAEDGTSLLHPSVVRFSEGKIGLVYSKMVKGTWRAWKVFRYSTDEGSTWSEEIKVSEDRYDYTTGAHDRFVTLSNGMVVNVLHCVVQMKSDTLQGKMLGTDLYATEDQGLTWYRLNEKTIINRENPYGLGEYGFYEASLVEYKPGELAIFGRNASGFLMGAYSNDMGRTWTEPVKLGIQHPLAPVRVQMIPTSGKILLVHNTIKDISAKSGIADRYVLATRTSQDGGITWQDYLELEYDGVHHYSYPAIFIDEGTIHLFHWKTALTENIRWKKVEIAHRMLPVSDFVP